MSSSTYIAGFTQPEEEIFYSTYEPTKEEIIEYAVKIGIDPEKEASIIYLARQGLLHPLPENWKPCYSKQVKAYYYYDRITKKSQWEHPIDVLYRAKVIEARKALAFDQSDSTSFGDSGFRSLKSNNNHSPNDQHPAKDTDPPDGSTDCSNPNQQVKKVMRLDGNASVLESEATNDAANMKTILRAEESDSNKENNSQDTAFGAAKSKDSLESAMAFSKKLSFNTGFRGYDTKNETLDTMKFANETKVSTVGQGFIITGNGSQFLKSNKKVDTGAQELARKRDSEMKGILRDTSLTHVRPKGTPYDDSGNDERKSVRFDIDTNVEKRMNDSKTGKDAIYNVESPFIPSSAGNYSDNDDDKDDDEDNDEDDGEEEEIVDDHIIVEERLDQQDREDDEGNAEMVKQTTSSETSEQDSEILTGAGIATLNKEGKSFSATASTLKAVNNDLTKEFDSKTLHNLQQAINQERERYTAKLDDELRSLAEREEFKIQNELEKERVRYEALLTNEKQRLKDLHQQNIDEIKEFYQVKLNEMKADYEEENTKEYAVYQETLQEEFDRRVKEVTDTHRATMATLQKNHDEIVEELERDLKMEEELLKKEHNIKLSEVKIKLSHELEMERQRMRETGEDRLYEKVRCEKRLLEDKYKCLKEKYTRLKTDVRISLERRKKRREQQQQQHSLLSNSYETDDRTNSKPLPSYSYDVGGKGISGPSSVNTLVLSEKSTPSNVSQVAVAKRFFTTGNNYAMDSKHGMTNMNDNGSVDPRKSLNHNNSNNNNNNNSSRSNNNNNINQRHHGDSSKPSETKYSKQYFQVKNIFASAQYEDNFSSDSEFHKIDNGGMENSCSSMQTGAATTATRPKRRIFTKSKSSSTSKLNSNKLERETGARPCTPVENLRIQLKKLEELEDQIPDCNLDAPYHLRYPFINSINSVENSDTTSNACVHGETSRNEAATATDRSELEFFKHRILLERDSVMRAKESLRTQKKIFKAKQSDVAVKHAIQNKQTMDQIFHEEKELTEMEVSLHRTRALLGEKVIRLRHLENSLKKLSEKDHPSRPSLRDIAFKPKETLSDLSSYSSSGFSSTDIPTTEHHYGRLQTNAPPANVDTADTILYLKHLHTEIQEIWSLLNPNNSTPPMKVDDMDFLNNDATAISSKQFCEIVLPPKAVTPTFNQPTAMVYTMGQQAMAHYIQNQHHYTITLLEKTRDLKNWLRQAKNEHEMLKKQSYSFSDTNTHV